MFNRNALTWDDDRKACAFVTSKDPGVLGFAKQVDSLVKGKGGQAVSPTLLAGIGVHEALRLYGIQYASDPKTPYTELSQKKQEADFLAFPRETFLYRSGDCDDLSILYASLFESLGIETAFITVPGHIFMAFCLGMDPSEAKSTFSRVEDLIFQNGKTWIPIEVTARSEGFLLAWQEGAKEWREFDSRQQAGFLPIRDGWQSYEPVGLPGTQLLSLPADDKVVDAFTKETTRFIEREIYPRVAAIQAEIKSTNESPKAVNKLGVLYARYGQYDTAERELLRAIRGDEYMPALLNLGNIYYLKGDAENAL